MSAAHDLARSHNEEIAEVAAFRSDLRRFLRRVETVANEAGLTSQRYDLLLMLASFGELRVTSLCELLQLRQTAVTELVKRSELAGLIERHRSTEDRRVMLLRLTPDGRRRFLEVFSALRDERGALTSAVRELQPNLRANSA